jgi:single-strand DNA-binding protein
VWREYAENVAESITKGMRLIVTGRLKSRQYEHKDGGMRTVFEIDVEEVGPALRYATAQVTRTQKGSGGGGGGQQQQSPRRAPNDDPWASSNSRPSGGSDPWSTPTGEEPPF